MARKNWIGKPFIDWCASDTDDTRKIVYTVHKGGMAPEVWQFTSEDTLDGIMLHRLQRSDILSIQLVENEWHTVLSYLGGEQQ